MVFALAIILLMAWLLGVSEDPRMGEDRPARCSAPARSPTPSLCTWLVGYLPASGTTCPRKPSSPPGLRRAVTDVEGI